MIALFASRDLCEEHGRAEEGEPVSLTKEISAGLCGPLDLLGTFTFLRRNPGGAP